MDCSQCGNAATEWYEGVCSECGRENQRLLDEHNARFDWWQTLSDAERAAQIRRQWSE